MCFRKRPLRSLLRRRLSEQEVPFGVRRALMRAHRAKEAGDYIEAAEIYARLADEAYTEGNLRPGAHMDLEATRTYLKAEDYDHAQARALHAVRAFLSQQRVPRVAMPLVMRIADAMAANGAVAEADRFREQVDDLLRSHGFSAADVASPTPASSPHERRGKLPEQCPSCYAPLHADEVIWLEPDRVQCTYCGNVILTE